MNSFDFWFLIFCLDLNQIQKLDQKGPCILKWKMEGLEEEVKKEEEVSCNRFHPNIHLQPY